MNDELLAAREEIRRLLEENERLQGLGGAAGDG
jgi:hypothetical protein